MAIIGTIYITVCKRMSLGSLKKTLSNKCVFKSFIFDIYIYIYIYIERGFGIE